MAEQQLIPTRSFKAMARPVPVGLPSLTGPALTACKFISLHHFRVSGDLQIRANCFCSWAANSAVMPNVCGWNGFSTSEDSASEIQAIYNAIQSVAAATKVDHRFILAVMMQESKGCVRVNTTGNGVRNPGLMQDHDGPHSCNDGGNVQVPCPDAEIQGMIQDGTGGTAAGDGLAATLNQAEGLGKTDAQGFYAAARIYNSGSIDPSGNLGAGGSTHCYASDIANRLKGWVLAPDTCTA